MKSITTALAIVATAALAACGGGDSETRIQDVNDTQTIGEGAYITYTLPAGQYNAQISASNNGVVVEWIGGSNCATSAEVKSYSQTCTLNQQGQLKILNPTLLGLGGSEYVTVKIVQK